MASFNTGHQKVAMMDGIAVAAVASLFASIFVVVVNHQTLAMSYRMYGVTGDKAGSIVGHGRTYISIYHHPRSGGECINRTCGTGTTGGVGGAGLESAQEAACLAKGGYWQWVRDSDGSWHCEDLIP